MYQTLQLKNWRHIEEALWLDYTSEWAQAGETPIPSSTIKPDRDFAAMCAFWEKGETDAAFESFVPVFIYFLTGEEGTILGATSLRPVLNPRLRLNGGNIGYGLRPSARGHGVGKILLELALDKMRHPDLPQMARFPVPERVLLSCDEANPASAHVIESCGGILQDMPLFEGVPTRLYWIQLFESSTVHIS